MKSSSSSRLKETEEAASPAAAVNEEKLPTTTSAPSLGQSASYGVLPGICNYSSDTESEAEEEGESSKLDGQVSPPNSLQEEEQNRPKTEESVPVTLTTVSVEKGKL